MELHTQIKKYRSNLNLSQEELAEKVYVTRQTISNWENNKNYPDIHSLLLLSSIFHISLDQLVKGDIDIMRQEISEAELKTSIVTAPFLHPCLCCLSYRLFLLPFF